MKKWVGIFVVLIGCLVYAIVKLSVLEYRAISQDPNASAQAPEMQSTEQIDANGTGAAIPEEESGTAATAAEVEAVTKAFKEFQSAVKSGDYEQAWTLASESFRSKLSFEDFKQGIATARAELVEATISPEPVTIIGGRLRLPVTNPSDGDGAMFFVQEDGQWKVDP